MTDRIRTSFETWAQKQGLSDHDTRRAAAVAQAAALAAEIERLNLIVSRLSVDGQAAVEM